LRITQAKKIEHPYFDRFNLKIMEEHQYWAFSKPVIIGHGISKADAFKNMLHLAVKMIDTDLLSNMKASFTGN
jgi:glycerol-3-phosphate acyltransferase PlsX